MSNPPVDSGSQALTWLDDGAPYSSRFDDRYHSHQDGGTTQSRGSFLYGCGLPAAWAGAASWRVLETGFGLGLNFLVTWQAWRDDPQRPQQLHFISTETWPVDAQALLTAAQQRYPQLLPLAQELAEQYWDMHSGIHRISLDQNRVHLTLAIGDAKQWLRSEAWQADSVYLDGFNPAKNPEIWGVDTLKAVARCCLPGHTRLATWCVARNVRDTLTACGFQVERVAGTPPKKHNLRAVYAPQWEPKKRGDLPPPLAAPLPLALRQTAQRHCAVVGAGIAGAHIARAMAERGWHVTVLDQAHTPAQGASALPAGLFAPHISPDDAPLSRLTRAGIRCTRRTAARLLQEGLDWQASGVLEHRVDKKLGLPSHSQPPAALHASQASQQASSAQRIQVGIDPQTPDSVPHSTSTTTAQHPAIWHAQAGWIKPQTLVSALLNHPLIHVQLHAHVQHVRRHNPTPAASEADHAPLPTWHIIWADQAQQTHTLEADCVFFAAAHGSLALAQPLSKTPLPLNAVRGQVAWGIHHALNSTQEQAPQWPMWPVNGKGSWIAAPHHPDGAQPGTLWISGGTFERENALQPPSPPEVEAALQLNNQRLSQLMPMIGENLAQQLFHPPHPTVQTWTGVRCTVADRTPLYGALSPDAPHVFLAAGLGSRGLTLAGLCAEALVSALHDEPLPIERSLAKLLSVERLASHQS